MQQKGLAGVIERFVLRVRLYLVEQQHKDAAHQKQRAHAEWQGWRREEAQLAIKVELARRAVRGYCDGAEARSE